MHDEPEIFALLMRKHTGLQMHHVVTHWHRVGIREFRRVRDRVLHDASIVSNNFAGGLAWTR